MPSTLALASLPAASFAVPVALWFAPSPSVIAAGQKAMPESASSHLKLTVTSPLFQPFEFAAGLRVASIDGLVLSIETLATVLALLPALSTAVPSTDWLAPSSETTSSGVQLAIPERPSVQSKWTVTSMLFQPFVFASGFCESADRRRGLVDLDLDALLRLGVPRLVDAPVLERVRALCADRDARARLLEAAVEHEVRRLRRPRGCRWRSA